MSNNPGKIVSLPDGRKGILYNKDVKQSGRSMVHLLDDKFKARKDESGKPLVSMQHLKNLTYIGFTD